MRVALGHLASANAVRGKRDAIWAGNDEYAKILVLDEEVNSSMQAIMAAAIAIDAFYAVIQEHVKIPSILRDQWIAKKTARYAQVTEVIKRAFLLKPDKVVALKGRLKQLYKLRDHAVHPSGNMQVPEEHPELHVAMDPWLIRFRAAVASEQVVAIYDTLLLLSGTQMPNGGKMTGYLQALRGPKGHG